MRIYLVGYMGSGKSTIAKSLAYRLSLDFVDLDRYIIEQQGMGIDEIFQNHSEQYFRELETEALIELSKRDNTVISTGGGTPCFNGNMDLIKASGLSIYLKVAPEMLISRLQSSHTVRPLVQGKTTEELSDFVNMSLASREPFYSLANITIANPSRDVTKIVEILSYYNENIN